MPSVLILQFAAHVPPGQFATSLTRPDVSGRLVRIDAGGPVPESLNGIPGLGLMGGPMSTNDGLPWIVPVSVLVHIRWSQNLVANQAVPPSSPAL